ncbi:MAG: HAMP domain-containing histidine kinase [Mailhella sp.]|nr:HAMP domain-containing histidine kinase [Mailhella sp.]
MKRLLWPDSLRGRLIILALFCLVLFQAVNTATLFFVQHQQREHRLTLLASQAAEWYTILNGKDKAQQEEILGTLSSLYNRKDWRLDFAIVPTFPDAHFRPGTEGPIVHAPALFADVLAPEGGPVPPFLAGFTRIGERQGLQLAVQLDDGRWLCITRHRAATLRQEKLQHGVFLAEFLVFFFIMFCLLYRETRQLEKLRVGAEQFGESPETAQKLPEEGCREIRETAQSLNRMRGRVLNSIEERDRMLSALRHDLRTPLTRLQLWAEEAEPEDVRDRLLENGRQIQALVSQSIELASSLSTTEKQVQMDIAAFVESVADDYAEEGRNVTLSSAELFSFTVRTRPTCLRRCLSNLIENSLKYAGSAEIALFRDHEGLGIEVRDSGPGIPENMLEKVLEPWFRVENSRNRETGGSGLGLAIAKNMATLSGAQLLLENRASGGLCASIRFTA